MYCVHTVQYSTHVASPTCRHGHCTVHTIPCMYQHIGMCTLPHVHGSMYNTSSALKKHGDDRPIDRPTDRQDGRGRRRRRGARRNPRAGELSRGKEGKKNPVLFRTGPRASAKNVRRWTLVGRGTAKTGLASDVTAMDVKTLATEKPVR